jgi:hypothetical protein
MAARRHDDCQKHFLTTTVASNDDLGLRVKTTVQHGEREKFNQKPIGYPRTPNTRFKNWRVSFRRPPNPNTHRSQQITTGFRSPLVANNPPNHISNKRANYSDY